MIDCNIYCLRCVDIGTVYAAGSNVNAQLGLGNQSPNVPTPARVCTNACRFVCHCYTVALSHILGVCDYTCHLVLPVPTFSHSWCVLDTIHFMCVFMSSLFGSCVVQIAYKGPPVCRVAAGGEFSVIADVVGNLYTFGNPEYGQLGMIALVLYW